MKIFKIIQISFSNILKNKRRSIVNATGVFVCVLFLIFILSFSEGFQKKLVQDNFVRLESGDIQIQKKVFKDVTLGDKTSLFSEDEVKKIRELSDVSSLSGRLYVNADFYSGQNRISAILIGTDFKEEEKICPDKHFLMSKIQDNFLNAPNQVLVNPTLGESIENIFQSENIFKKNFYLSGQSLEGRKNVEVVQIGGFIQPPINISTRAQIVMPLKEVRNFFEAKDLMNYAVISIKPSANIDVVQQKIQKLMGDTYEVTNWRTANTFVRVFMSFLVTTLNISSFVIFILCCLFVVNGTLANFNSRKPEIGLLMALGVFRKTIVLLFFFETLILTLFSSVLAIISVCIIAYFVNKMHFIIPSIFASGRDYINIYVTFYVVVLSFVSALLLGVMSGVYPSIKLLQFNPTEVLNDE